MNVWDAIDQWAERLAVKVGLLADEDECRRLDATDLDLKIGPHLATQFTKIRERQDILAASRRPTREGDHNDDD